MRAGLLGLLMTASIVVACGSPDAPPREFVFTPVPYTVLPEEARDQCRAPGCGEAVSAGESGLKYFADFVIVQVDEARERAFRKWADSYGFDVQHGLTNQVEGHVVLAVKVPRGSVPDAIRLIEDQPGVISAEPNSLGEPLAQD